MAEPTTVTASVLTGVRTLELIDRALPPPGPGEVRVRIRAVGLCGSDLHYYHQLRNGDAAVREPLTLGHEAAGVVEAVGPPLPESAFRFPRANTAPLAPGDRVALELGSPCGACARCRHAGGRRYHLCPDMQFAASARRFPHTQGALQAAVNRPAQWCFPLPPALPLALGALAEPLAVAVHAHRRSGLGDGEGEGPASGGRPRILILGAGPVGLLVAAVCRHRGGTTDPRTRPHIVVLDLVPARVDYATAHGLADAGMVLPPALAGAPPADAAGGPFAHAQAVSERLQLLNDDQGAPFDVAFECTGQAASVQTGVYATAAGGRLVVVGMGQAAQLVPLGVAAAKEVDVVGVFRYAGDYAAALALLADAAAAAGALAPLAGIVSHRVPGLAHAAAAFARASQPVDEDGRPVLKVMIECD